MVPVVRWRSRSYVNEANVGKVIPSPFNEKDYQNEMIDALTNNEQRVEWSANGLAYGKRDELYAFPAAVVDSIEAYCQEKQA